MEKSKKLVVNPRKAMYQLVPEPSVRWEIEEDYQDEEGEQICLFPEFGPVEPLDQDQGGVAGGQRDQVDQNNNGHVRG